MACEGIYADVQSGEEELSDEIGEQSERWAQKTQEETEKDLDQEKFLWMLKMYKDFKADYVRIIRFNSSASVVPFGKNLIKMSRK